MARSLALALGGAEARAAVKGALAASAVPEQKLHLASYLGGPVAFTTAGERRTLSAAAPPAQPVLALVPMETDFTAQAPLNARGLAERSCAVGATETLEAAAERCAARAAAGARPAAAFASTATTAGLFATAYRVLDAHEPWIKGNPELETHVFAKRS